MVGGRIIDITEIRSGVTRLWCVEAAYGSVDECCVNVKTEQDMPSIGDRIWWQSGKVYWDNDRKILRKVGYSYTPPEGES